MLTQLLPSGIGPEGFVAIPERGLIASANEKDYNNKEPGLSSHVTIYQLQNAPASYPHLTNENGHFHLLSVGMKQEHFVVDK